MGIFAWVRCLTEPQRTIVETHGRVSLLGVLSLPIAFVMSSAARGHRVASADEYTVPAFGFVYFKARYELPG